METVAQICFFSMTVALFLVVVTGEVWGWLQVATGFAMLGILFQIISNYQ